MTDVLDSTVASPCQRICEIHPIAGVCLGCFRTIDEISTWARLDDAAKRKILAVLPDRRIRWASAGTEPA
jgi:predicted Fe-S protein YdhL (DUF1289 family)